LQRDIMVDFENSRVYHCGETNTIHYPNFDWIAARNFDDTDWDYYPNIVGARYINNMVKQGDYIYVVGERTSGGIPGGESADVRKFDTELNLVDWCDTGRPSYACWFDWDGNLVIRSGSYNTDPTTSLVLLDTDLNLISSHLVNARNIYGSEGHIIPFMDDGTPEVPGYEIEYGISDSDPMRLIGFEYPQDKPYVIAMGDKKMAFFKSQ